MKKVIYSISLMSLSIIVSAQIKIIPGGNVGVGQSNPTFAKLEVLNPVGGNIFSASMGTTTPTINIWQTNEITSPYARTCLAYRDCSFEIYDISHTASRLWIDRNTGNVGLGIINSPTYKFYVAGSSLCTGSWINSDNRFKKNIQNIDNPLEKIMKMSGRVYDFKTEEFKGRNFEKGRTIGFIAQELKDVLPEAVKQDSDGYYAINYDEVIPLLLEGIKEQQKIIETQENEIKNVKDGIQALTQQAAFSSQNNTPSASIATSSNASNAISNSSILYQNVPNPFSENTEIAYTIAPNVQKALLCVFDMQGILLKTYEDLKHGDNKLSINGRELKAGMYLYSLIVDGKEVDTKRMILTK